MTSDAPTVTYAGKSKISFGRFIYGGNKIVVQQAGEGAPLTIGSFCAVGENVMFMLGGNHRLDWATTFPFGDIKDGELGGMDIPGHSNSKGGITIGNDVWIGARVTIMSGVTVGDGAVLAATATVTKDVAPYEIVGGNPARHIRFRFEPEIIELLLKLKWWDLPVEQIRTLAQDLSMVPDKTRLLELVKVYRGTKGAV